METSSFEKSTEEWLVELNDPQAEHRRDVLTALVDSGTLDDRLIHELKLIARGDPDSKAQFLAKRVLKSRGIKILRNKQTRLPWNSDFWMGFLLSAILNFILLVGLTFIALVANETTSILQLVVNVVLLIYFWRTRKDATLGVLAAFVVFMVILSICQALLFSLRCWPDGCAVPQ